MIINKKINGGSYTLILKDKKISSFDAVKQKLSAAY
jgi:hypothetical protein